MEVPPFRNFLLWLKDALSPPAASRPAPRTTRANTRRPHGAATAERGRRHLLFITSLSETPGSEVKLDSGPGGSQRQHRGTYLRRAARRQTRRRSRSKSGAKGEKGTRDTDTGGVLPPGPLPACWLNRSLPPQRGFAASKTFQGFVPTLTASLGCGKGKTGLGGLGRNLNEAF